MASVYTWIRDGVKRAVLLGFSDAVEQLGLPEEEAAISPHLLTRLKEPAKLARQDRPQIQGPQTSLRPQRKALGRSLNQLSSGDEHGNQD